MRIGDSDKIDYTRFSGNFKHEWQKASYVSDIEDSSQASPHVFAHKNPELEGVAWKKVAEMNERCETVYINIGFFRYMKDLVFRIWDMNHSIYFELTERFDMNSNRISKFMYEECGGTEHSWRDYVYQRMWNLPDQEKPFSYKIPKYMLCFLVKGAKLLALKEAENEEYEETRSA